MEVRNAQIHPVKGHYGTAMLAGAVLGLGCGTVRAWTQPQKSVRRSVAPQSDHRLALLSQEDRGELREIFAGNLSLLQQRASVPHVKAEPKVALPEPDLQPPGYTEEPLPETAVSADEDEGIAPSLIVGAIAAGRPGSVEQVSVTRIEVPEYPSAAPAPAAQRAPKNLRTGTRMFQDRIFPRGVRKRLPG